MSSSGDVFASIYPAATGILKWDADTGAFTQVYAGAGYGWLNWFEDSRGNIFVSNTVNNAASLGILKWDADSNTFVQVWSDGYRWSNWYENKFGDVLVSSSVSGTTGLWFDRVLGSFVNKGFRYDSSIQFEDSAGNVFLSGSSTNAYIELFRADTKTLAYQVWASGYAWKNWIKDSSGNIFVASAVNTSANTGILKWDADGGSFVKVYPSQANWTFYQDDVSGNVFAVSSAMDTGILKWDADSGSFVKVYGEGYDWRIKKDDDGVFAVSLYFFGKLRYDADAGIFWIVRKDYCGYALALDYTIFNYSQSLSILFNDEGSVILGEQYGTPVSNAVTGYVLSVDKKLLLYLEMEDGD
jgi:hypothetical protein